MIKIRTLNINDISRLRELCDDNEALNKIEKSKIECLFQPVIPHNFRTFPSLHLAIEEKNILGFVILKCASKPNNTWQIEHVFVRDELRNEGVGEELIRYVISLYGGYGVEHFLAEVNPLNSAATSLFHTCGFRKCAKVSFYSKEINTASETEENILSFDKDFVIRPQALSDVSHLEKLELSSIPPDLRFALGRSKEFFKGKKNSYVLIHKPRNMIIGWFNIDQLADDHFASELLISPGWTHLYEQLLNTVMYDYLANTGVNVKLTIKVTDYLTELNEILRKLNFLPADVRELLIRIIWQKVKEKKKKLTRGVIPSAAPT